MAGVNKERNLAARVESLDGLLRCFLEWTSFPGVTEGSVGMLLDLKSLLESEIRQWLISLLDRRYGL
jgi:hypothetical protein